MKKQIKTAKDNLNDKDKWAYFMVVGGIGCIIGAIILSNTSMVSKFALMGMLMLSSGYLLYNFGD